MSAGGSSGPGRAVVLDGTDVVPELAPVFQPLVQLDDDVPAGYEALVRGTGALRTPDQLFDAARAEGCLGELDWACREAAIALSRRAALRHPLSLFVNAEPEAVEVEALARWGEFADLRCFAEFTERGLLGRPADLLRAIEAVREQDWGIALDDIGADPASLALMPLLAPDVLKLDRALLRDGSVAAGRVVYAVLAQAERTGATVVAEGIETEQDRDTARSWGVRLGQGWLWGRPGPLPDQLPAPSVPVRVLPRVLDRAQTPSPFALVNDAVPSRRVGRGALDALWTGLLEQALASPADSVVLACAGVDALSAPVVRALDLAAARLPLVALLSGGQPPAGGYRTAPLDRGDPAAFDLDVVVLGAEFAAAVVARPGAGSDWDLAVTFDRSLVVRAAAVLLARLPG